jgi:UDP-GlcNAc:undecaprenyl-phosphate GlcNAc-1-phosphate transferase
VNTLLVALVASTVLVGVVTAALPRLGIMDVPNHRTMHEGSVPRGGGIPFAVCVVLAISASSSWASDLVWLVAGATVLGVIGLTDDVRDVPAPVRLGLQLLVTLTVGTGLVDTGSDLAPVVLFLAGIGSAVWLTGYVNVYNFMDGANGVAGFHAAVAGGWFAYVGSHEHVASLTAGGLALLGASVGFLPWNFPRARVFLGDAGSYSVGAMLGSLGLMTLLSTHSLLLAVAPLCVFLADTMLTLTRRAGAGKAVMTAHREHVYQRITLQPGSPWPAVATTSASLVCVAAAAATSTPVCLACWCVILLVYVSLPRLAEGRSTARAD